MFKSTLVKLTAWYIALLVVINVALAIIYFQISLDSTSRRLENFYSQTVGRAPDSEPISYDDIHSSYIQEASKSLLIRLSLYILAILVLSGIVSYIISRYTLKPVEAAHLAQTRFASDASHELSTPLAVIKSEIEVTLRDKKMTPKQLRRTLESTLEEVEGLSIITDSLLLMSQMEHSSDLPKQQLDTKLIIVESMYRYRQDGDRIKLTGKSGLMVHGNEAALTELFAILIDNALKYSPKASKVLVKVFKQGSSVTVEISNQGLGIQPKDQPHIFERFYRADNARTHSATRGGFGLGLAIAQQVADLHKAHITVTSIQNKKTTFSVTF